MHEMIGKKPRAHRWRGCSSTGLVPRIMEDGVPEVLLDALEEQDRRARAPHGRQDHGHRRAGVRIDPIGDYLRPPAQSLNEIQQLPVVAKTVDLEPHSREPVFDAPAILAERINFDRAVRVQHRSGSSSTLTTRKLGRILRSKGIPPLTLRSGRASRKNSNISRRIRARVIEAPCYHRLFEPTHEGFGRDRLKMKVQCPVKEAYSPELSRQ